jgi:hypothetical protein
MFSPRATNWQVGSKPSSRSKSLHFTFNPMFSPLKLAKGTIKT